MSVCDIVGMKYLAEKSCISQVETNGRNINKLVHVKKYPQKPTFKRKLQFLQKRQCMTFSVF